MSTTLDQIRKEISSLPQAERYDLWLELATEFESPGGEDSADDPDVAALWDAEIINRMASIEDKSVELVSGADAEAQARALIARYISGPSGS